MTTGIGAAAGSMGGQMAGKMAGQAAAKGGGAAGAGSAGYDAMWQSMAQSGAPGGGLFDWAQALRQGLLESYYGRGLAKGMAPIQAKATTASMLQAVVEQKNYMDRLKARKDVMGNVEEMRSPAALMERARKMEGYGEEARRLMAQAKGAGNEAAILDAVRMARRGAEQKKAVSLVKAGREAEMDISSRMRDYEEWQVEQANKERIQQMMFALYGMQLEAQRYKVGAEMQAKVGKHAAISGMLTPS